MLSIYTFVSWCCVLVSVQAIPAPTATPTTTKASKLASNSSTESASSSSVTHGAALPSIHKGIVLNGQNSSQGEEHRTATKITEPWDTVKAPSSGCILVSRTGGYDNFCTCAGDKIEALTRGVAVTGKEKGKATTTCGSIPTGYVPVPRVVPESPSYLKAPTGDCVDGSITHAECWDKLDLTGYVPWWWLNFNKHCQGLPFGDCFYALATPYSPSNCSQLSVDAECKQPAWSDFQDNWNGIRNFYVAQNIWNLNTYLINYWIAIGQAESTAVAMLGNLISTVNPVRTTNVYLDDVLVALSFGAAMLQPAIGLGKALVAGSYQSAQVNRYLFPVGTLGGQQADWDAITGKIAGLTQTLQESITNALAAMLENPDNFVPFTNTGAFSSGLPPLNNLKDQVLTGFNTFMVSQAYQNRGIILTRTLDTDVHALQTNGTKLYWDTMCGAGYDQYGVCDTFWYDSNSRITYSLADGDSLTHNFNSEMETLFFNYTTPELLIRGADICAQASDSTQGSTPQLHSDPKAIETFSCLSNIKVCTWNLTPPPSGQGEVGLVDCDVREVLPRWGISGCKGNSDDVTDLDAPRGYLGWGILDNDGSDRSDWSFCNNVDG